MQKHKLIASVCGFSNRCVRSVRGHQKHTVCITINQRARVHIYIYIVISLVSSFLCVPMSWCVLGLLLVVIVGSYKPPNPASTHSVVGLNLKS